MTIIDDAIPAAPPRATVGRSLFDFWRSPATKFFVTGLLTLALMIPLWMVLVLTGERERNRDDVAGEVGREWGGPQDLYGPLLIIPFTIKTKDGSNETAIRHLAVLPETLDVTADAKTEERNVSIYRVPVYASLVNVKGHFSAVDAQRFGADVTAILWDQAYLSFAINDISGVEQAALAVAGQKLALEPGTSGEGDLITPTGSVIKMGPGVHALVGQGQAAGGFEYALDLRLRGTGLLEIVPVGRQSIVTLKSNWPSPNLAVGIMPSDRTISTSGFSATWRVPFLARQSPQSWVIERTGDYRFNDSAVGARFVEPVDFYSLVTRALKYGLMFIGATFLTVFMLEVLSDRRIHLVQYCLVGLILVMFFVLLLAFAERIGFGLAYLIAATATTIVVAAFVGTVLASRIKAAIAALSLTGSFGLLYAILQLEDLALLAGAVVGFIALSLVLFATRRVDWSGLGGRLTPAQAVAAQ